MIKFVLILIAFGAMYSCGDVDNKYTEGKITKNLTETFGEKITLSDTVAISQVLANAENFVDKKVLIKGQVVEVCPKKGCWIDLASDKAGEQIKVKVQDDVIVFPQSAKGKIAVVEGTVKKIELTINQARDWMEHLAEEKGEAFDPSSIKGPMTIYRIQGVGAEIQG
jgi:hypothetical protein